jgi:hypothetical protein
MLQSLNASQSRQHESPSPIVCIPSADAASDTSSDFFGDDFDDIGAESNQVRVHLAAASSAATLGSRANYDDDDGDGFEDLDLDIEATADRITAYAVPPDSEALSDEMLELDLSSDESLAGTESIPPPLQRDSTFTPSALQQTIQNSVARRIVIQSCGACLFDSLSSTHSDAETDHRWRGDKAHHTVSSLVQFFHQFARQIDTGTISVVRFDAGVHERDFPLRRPASVDTSFDSLLTSTTSVFHESAAHANSSLFDHQRHAESRMPSKILTKAVSSDALDMVCASSGDNTLTCTVFVDVGTPTASVRNMARRVVDEFQQSFADEVRECASRGDLDSIVKSQPFDSVPFFFVHNLSF